MKIFGLGKENEKVLEFERILSDSPYLRTYLNGDLKRFNPEKWQQDMALFKEPIKNFFDKKYSHGEVDLIKCCHAVVAARMGLFDERVSADLRFSTILDLLMFGYEINDLDKTNYVTRPILKRHVQDKIINPKIDSYIPTNSILNLYNGVMSIGVVLRRYDEGNDGNELPTNLPSGSFEKILSGVDLSGLDKI